MKSLFFLNKFTTPVLILVMGVGNGLISSQAYAGQKHRQKQFHKQWYGYNNQHVVQRHRYHKRNRSGDLLAAGMIGLAIGALIVDSTNKRKISKYNYNYTENDYYNNSYKNSFNPEYEYYILPEGGENYNNEDVITYEESASLEPWTPGWREYCSQRYRSFNSQSGTYKGYDGLHHFCVAE